MVGADFFHMGMDYFRRQHHRAGNTNIHSMAQHIPTICLLSVFLVVIVSDDMVWCRRNLAGSDTYGRKSADRTKPHFDVIFFVSLSTFFGNL